MVNYAKQVDQAIRQLTGVVKVSDKRDIHGRLIAVVGIPQFLRSVALAKPLVSREDMLKDIHRPRVWVMPNKDAPKAESMASIMAKYEVADHNAPVSVQVALANKSGSTALSTYDNWAEFKAKHDSVTYPIKKTATLEGVTVVIVRATPWAGREKVERKPREGKSKAEIVGEMLLRPEGCTSKEVCAAINWPAVSMPNRAKVCGLTLRKEKVDGVTRYWGSK